MADHSHLEAARVRREAIHEALVGLEDALATPIGDAGRWRLRVAMAIDHAAVRLEEHRLQTEAPGGFLDHVVAQAPRLSCKADRLREDHEQLHKGVEHLQHALADLDEVAVAERGVAVRNEALEFLGQLVRHRQRGADLIYEAFNVDIGAQ